MFMIPGFLVALVTFPGIICHEIAHKFFCDIAGVPVYAAAVIPIFILTAAGFEKIIADGPRRFDAAVLRKLFCYCGRTMPSRW